MNTSCSKCGAAMPPIKQSPNYSAVSRFKFITTAYLCDCGHFNNLKRRKGFDEYKANIENGGAA